MTLKQKISRYLIGLSMGLILVFFFLDKKNTAYSYLPNARVLKNIFSKPIVSVNYFKILENKYLKDLKNGKIDFSKSQIDRTTPCNSYWVENINTTFVIDNCPDTAWVKRIIIHQHATQ